MLPPSCPPAESLARFNGHRYHAYNDWAKREHGGRLQKVSIDAGFTCPNRDGSLGVGGCTFCNNEGFTPSYLREQRDIVAQIDTALSSCGGDTRGPRPSWPISRAIPTLTPISTD